MSVHDQVPAERAPAEGGASHVEGFLEEVLPRDFDWRDFVMQHPKSSVALAAIAGAAIGKSQGREILGAVSGFVSGALARHVNDWIGDDVL